MRINGVNTEWFDVTCGLKQGCILSPLLFNLYVNDLIDDMKQSGYGVNIGGESLAILLYADDIAISAESAEDLQAMLNILNNWCVK